MEVKDFLDNCYNNISNKEISIQSEIYYSIIQIKKENPDLCNYSQSIYIDIKKFIKNYFDSVEEKDHGYDFIDTKKIINSVEAEYVPSARLELYSFTIRLIKSKNQDELVDEINKKRILTKFEFILHKKSIFKYPEGVFLISSYNIFTIAISLFLLSLVGVIIVQEAPLKYFELFSFEYENFCKIDPVNQFLNIIAKPLGLADKFKIIPLNVSGVFLLITFKLIYLSIVVNFLYEKVKDNLIR